MAIEPRVPGEALWRESDRQNSSDEWTSVKRSGSPNAALVDRVCRLDGDVYLGKLTSVKSYMDMRERLSSRDSSPQTAGSLQPLHTR